MNHRPDRSKHVPLSGTRARRPLSSPDTRALALVLIALVACLFVVPVSFAATGEQQVASSADRALRPADTPRPPLTAPAAYPAAARGDAVDVLHGVRVADPYRAFEALDAEETRAFARTQDELTRSLLDAAAPAPRLGARLREIVDLERWIRVAPRGDRVFAVATAGSGTSGLRIVMLDQSTSDAREPETLLASDALDLGHDDEGPDELSGLVSPSPDGRFLAYGTRRPGSRWQRVRVLDVESRRHLPEILVGLHATQPNLSWTADSAGFFWTRHPDPPPGAEQSHEPDHARLLYHHLSSAPAEDLVILAASDDAPDRSFAAFVSEDGHHVAIHVTRDDWAGQQLWSLPLPDGVVSPEATGDALAPRLLVADTEHFWGWLGAAPTPPDVATPTHLLYYTNRGAPNRRIVALALDSDASSPTLRDVVAEGDEALLSPSRAAGHLFVPVSRDAVPVTRVHRLDGGFVRELELPFLGMAWSGYQGTDKDRRALVGLSSLTDPGTVLRVDPRTGAVDTLLRPRLAYEPRDFVVRRILYPSDDGTKVPLFLAHRRDLEPSTATPVVVYAYGAWGWSAFPWFQPDIVAWMERGGVYALAGVRGGGEYGEAWHAAGRGRHRQTAVDDFVAAARWLRGRGIGTRAGIVANGGSASGPLVGTAVTQSPEAWDAALIDIPALDLVRYEKLLGGTRWRPEFGRVEVEEEFRVLHTLSPYHQVERSAARATNETGDTTDSTEAPCLPPILVSASEKDEATVPSHAYKFVAAAQRAQRAATRGGRTADCTAPVLLQVAWGAGHSAGTTPEQSADTWTRRLAFLERVLPSGRSAAGERRQRRPQPAVGAPL
ncbi:MAG: prolyl oligopeptidase family serine peptidase [Acidobacteriota bacterium]